MRKQVLVVGSTGMLGRQVMAAAVNADWQPVGLARIGAEISADLADPAALRAKIGDRDFGMIVNCAAITDLNLCERDPIIANAVNALAPGELGRISDERGAIYVHVSTDHYFLGDGRRKHLEGDAVTIVNTYAKTKFDGEQAALTAATARVFRTNIVGFRGLPKLTFAEWALTTLLQARPFVAFEDFYTSSLTARALARAIFELTEKNLAPGLWNVAGSEVFSKKEFIMALAKKFGLSLAGMKSGRLAELGGAPRAGTLGLDSARAEAVLGKRLPGLEEAVADLYEEYIASSSLQDFLQKFSLGH